MTTLHGVIVKGTSYISANILKNGILRLETALVPKEAARISIVVDTGFSGGFSLPEKTLQFLNLDLLGYLPYILADGSEREVPTYLGHVVVGRRALEARFIPGQSLIGTEFMASVFSLLSKFFYG